MRVSRRRKSARRGEDFAKQNRRVPEVARKIMENLLSVPYLIKVMKGSLVIVVLILIIASVAIILINDGDSDEVNSDLIENRSSDLVGQQDLDSDPAEDKCEKGKVFGYPPVNLDKTLVVVPLGLMSGGHVTPIDHQYFQKDRKTHV